MRTIVVAIVCALVAVQGWAADPAWVKVATGDSSSASFGAVESYGEMERRLYLKPATSPMEKPARRVAFQEGDFETPPETALSLDGAWNIRLQDGRTIPATVPCSIYTALWKAGVTGDPYFGTNDLDAVRYCVQTSVWSRAFSFAPKAGSRYRLSFGGVCDEAEVSLNGRILGQQKGMFGGPDFVLDSADLKKENILDVVLFPIMSTSTRTNIATLGCVRGAHYCKLPSVGVWQSVSIREIPDVEVRRQFVVTRSAERREIDYRVDVDAARDASGELRIAVRPVGFSGKSFRFSERVELKPGENALRYAFELPEAELWWPAGHGAARTYEITASFGPSSRTDAFGIRTFRFVPGPDGARTNLYNRVAEVNGRQLFLKGAGWCACDALLRLDEPMYRRTIDRAVEQGVNFFRAWGAGLVETDEFYRQCDRAGILVLQELPVPWDHLRNPGLFRSLVDTAQRSVERLRNRPSLAAWGGGNELSLVHPEFGIDDEVVNTLGRICCERDGTRDFWRSDPWAGSAHHHIVWTRWTTQKFLAHFANREGVCLNEYGLEALMNVESLRRIAPAEEHDMFPWRRFTAMAHHTATFNHDYYLTRDKDDKRDSVRYMRVGRRYYPQTDLVSYVLGSQIAQVYATAYHAYNARTQFPRTGMNTYYKLNDVYPGSSWAVVDWFGAPKLAHYALKRAYRPLCAAPRLAGHEFGAQAKVPFYILDDAGELNGDSKWEVRACFYDANLEMVAERRFSGSGSVGPVCRLGEAESDPARPLSSPSVLAWELVVDGEVRTRDFVVLNLFNEYDNPRMCAGFAATKLKMSVDGKGRCVVSNIGRVAAVGVMLDLGKNADKAVLDDNFFFLPAGESRAVSVSSASDVRGVFALNAP